MTVNPIPDGFTTVTPHLVVEGAGDAIDFYKKAFGAEEMGRMPMADGKRLMHAVVGIGDSMVMLVDALEEFGSKGPKGLGGTATTIHLFVGDADAAFERAVAAGCEVAMPLEDMFWGDRYGRLVDPFGHSWSIATHVRDVSEQDMAQAAQEAFQNGGSG